ncbi:MAG: histidine kinase, partial [Deinococcales bacterium]
DFQSDDPIFVRPAMGGIVRPDGIQPGDRFDGVVGIPRELFDQASMFHRAIPVSSFAAGSTVAYTVLRDGDVLEVQVPVVHWTLAGIARASWHALVTDTPVASLAGWLALLLAAFLFWRRPRNLTVQLLLLYTTLGAVSTVSWIGSPLSVSDVSAPWSLWAAALGSHLIHPLLMLPVSLHLILTFPRPRPWLSRRRWILPLVYAVPWLILVATSAGVTGLVWFVQVLVYSVAGFVGVANALLTRLPPEERAQARWFAFGFAISSLGFLAFGLEVLHLIPDSVVPVLDRIPADLIWVVCIAIAVLRYRLFAIDVILERTLVYGALTAVVVGVYALVVSGVGGWIRPASGLPLSLLATGLVAVAFQPMRERLQRGVSRMLYGRRDEPYQVLTDLGRVLGAPSVMTASGAGGGTGAQALGVLTDTVARALKLPYVGLALDVEGTSRVVAETGTAGLEPEAFALAYQGQPLGELRVAPRGPEETFTARERRLLDAIARQASVAAFAVRLNGELQRSRERLVNALEDERRRLRRDLHDGLGPTLAAVSMQLDAARHLVGDDPENAVEVLGSLKVEVQDVLHEIRRLVYALRPPALDELGLVSALREHVHRSAGSRLQARFEAPGELPPLPAAVEVAAYRIAQEAVANVVRHAEARSLRVTLRVGKELELTVEDDGVGIAPDRRLGVGLSSMAERAEELGGSLTVSAAQPSGTRVVAQLPLQDAPPASAPVPEGRRAP